MLAIEAKVLLSISLSSGKQKIEICSTRCGFGSQARIAQLWVKSVDVVRVFPSDSNSAVMLTTLPISLLDILPEHPAYKVDLVRNEKLLLKNLNQRLLL